MSNRLLFFLVVMVILGMGLLLLRPFLEHHTGQASLFPLTLYDIRGSAVVHKDTPYILNFTQQKELVDQLAKTHLAPPELATHLSSADLGFNKLIFYRFNAPDMMIVPMGVLEDRLVFSSPTRGQELYIEPSPPSLLKLLSQTYDP